MVVGDDLSASVTSDSLNAVVAFSMEIGDELGDLDEAVLHLAQLLLEYFAHVVILLVLARAGRPVRPHVPEG